MNVEYNTSYIRTVSNKLDKKRRAKLRILRYNKMLIRTLQLTVKNLVHINNDTVIVDATLHALTITTISYRGNQANMPGYNEVPKYPS